MTSVTFNADTPSDHFYCMRTYTINSMTITGKIGAGEKTISLYKWALLAASNPNCYKEIEVEYTHAGQTIRNVKFSKAFVVDYSESYSKGEGVGHFSILIRQLADVDIECANEESCNVNSNNIKVESAPPLINNPISEVAIAKEMSNNKTIPRNNHILKRPMRLKANNEYTANGYNYKTDDLGRITCAEGKLILKDVNRNKDHQRKAGGTDRLKTDEGGHLIASIFNGSGKIDNLVPMNAHLNVSEYKVLENTWKKALEEKKDVYVKVKPVYKGNSARPSEFNIAYTINGKKYKDTLTNYEGGDK